MVPYWAGQELITKGSHRQKPALQSANDTESTNQVAMPEDVARFSATRIAEGRCTGKQQQVGGRTLNNGYTVHGSNEIRGLWTAKTVGKGMVLSDPQKPLKPPGDRKHLLCASEWSMPREVSPPG
jgi:hypothetical protein